jgi:hypothetical protein
MSYDTAKDLWGAQASGLLVVAFGDNELSTALFQTRIARPW